MMNWEPDLYRRFEAERSQPAKDLLARLPQHAPAMIVDLGCGPGNSTQLLAHRFPEAELLGVDSSEAMLRSARLRLPEARFEVGDISAWRPGATPDLIFANASLQWVPDHEILLPRLLGLLAPGGVLAVQMPDDHDEPAEALLRQLAAEPPWAARIGDPEAFRHSTLALTEYYDLLAPRADRVDVWLTTYRHPLASPQAIVDWMRGSALRGYLERLDAGDRPAFLDRYAERLAGAYPARADGRVLLAFPRQFLLAVRKA